jgi:hypothetical protein
VKGPGGVDVPTVAARLIGDVVAHSTVGGLGGDVVALVGPGNRAGEAVAAERAG